MRIKLFPLAFLVAGVLVLTCQPEGQAQFRGQGGPGGRGGFGGGGFDPGMIFDRYAQGKSSISINDYPAERREGLVQFMKERGITNGQITRDQFTAYIEQRMKGFGGGRPGGFGGSGGPRPFGPPGGMQ